MIIETKRRVKYLLVLIKNQLYALNENQQFYLSLKNYTEDLTHKFDETYNIMKIYEVEANSFYYMFTKLCSDNLIWERKEENIISSEEAFKILKEHYGCDVKIKG